MRRKRVSQVMMERPATVMKTKLAQKRDLRRFLKLARSWTLENRAYAQKLTIKKIESTK